MSRTGTLLILAMAVLVIAGGMWFWLGRAADAPTHDHDHDGHASYNRPDNSKVEHIETFRQHHQERLAELMHDPEFVGGETSRQVKSPKSEQRMIDGFRVKVPDLSEARIEAEAYQEQLTYTLGNLSPSLLDSMMHEYRHEYGALLQEMGLQADCDGAQCGYRLSDGPFLQALADSGLTNNDVILTVNSRRVDQIGDYATFKQTVFSRSDTLELGIARAGDVSVVNIPVRQAASFTQSLPR